MSSLFPLPSSRIHLRFSWYRSSMKPDWKKTINIAFKLKKCLRLGALDIALSFKCASNKHRTVLGTHRSSISRPPLQLLRVGTLFYLTHLRIVWPPKQTTTNGSREKTSGLSVPTFGRVPWKSYVQFSSPVPKLWHKQSNTYKGT